MAPISEYYVSCFLCGEEELLEPNGIRTWVNEHDKEHEG